MIISIEVCDSFLCISPRYRIPLTLPSWCGCEVYCISSCILITLRDAGTGVSALANSTIQNTLTLLCWCMIIHCDSSAAYFDPWASLEQHRELILGHCQQLIILSVFRERHRYHRQSWPVLTMYPWTMSPIEHAKINSIVMSVYTGVKHIKGTNRAAYIAPMLRSSGA
jgi:hypothetical protein